MRAKEASGYTEVEWGWAKCSVRCVCVCVCVCVCEKCKTTVAWTKQNEEDILIQVAHLQAEVFNILNVRLSTFNNVYYHQLEHNVKT
jgi:hypothetical protein